MRLVLVRFAIVYVVLALVPWTWSTLVPFVAKSVLGLEAPPFRGSGDTTWNYLHVGVDLTIAAIGTAGWTALGRGERFARPLLALLVRAYLFKGMVTYGLMKVFGTQFPEPSLVKLTTTFGESTPMGVLWAFMGTSQPYCVVTGLVEVLGGVLLLSRRTTTLGAMVILGAMTNVFALNLCYDVPVKLHALHLLLAAGFLVARDGRRLVAVLVLGRAAQAPTPDRIFTQPRLDRIGHAVKWVLAVGLVLSSIATVSRMRRQFFAVEPPPLHGIWEARTPDAAWTQLVLARRGRASVRFADGDRHAFRYETHTDAGTVTLEPRDDLAPELTFAYERPAHDRLVVQIDDVRLTLHRVDDNALPLRRHAFHWVSPQPAHPWK